MSVSVDDLAAAVVQELQTYSREVAANLRASVKVAAKECVKEVKKRSPKDTGKYAKGWAAKITYEHHDDIRIAVHNTKHYRRIHLLEDGHAKVKGDRVPGHPHVKPAADVAAALLENDVKVRIGGK